MHHCKKNSLLHAKVLNSAKRHTIESNECMRIVPFIVIAVLRTISKSTSSYEGNKCMKMVPFDTYGCQITVLRSFSKSISSYVSL